METAVAKLTPDHLQSDRPQLANTATPKRTRKPRASEEVARYFLAKDGSTPTKPELGEEAQSEATP